VGDTYVAVALRIPADVARRASEYSAKGRKVSPEQVAELVAAVVMANVDDIGAIVCDHLVEVRRD
jgi:hypothetical protein